MNRLSLLLLAFVLSVPVHIARSCGVGVPAFYGYSFINTDLVPADLPYAPYLLRFEDFYNQTNLQRRQTTDNISEWQKRSCPDAVKQDIYDIIYKVPASDLRLIRTAAQNPKMGMSARLANNTFAQYLAEKKCLETIDYLLYAKACEPHVLAPADPWKSPKRDTFAMESLIQQGRKAFKKTDSHYIRLRYAYQMIRLAHYKKNYRQVLELYNYLLPKTDADSSIIDYWIVGHRAGALRALGHRVEAAYLYALIFKNCPSKRPQAFQSFVIKTDEEWEECLLLCQSDAERAVLYTIRANAEDSRAAEAMQKIYDLDPDNENLELLLLKEIQKLEKDLLGKSFNINTRENKRYHKIPRPETGYYLIQLQELVQRIKDEGTIPNLPLWMLADAYLKFLAGDLYAAEKAFARAKPHIESEALKEQLEVFLLALKINNYSEIDQEDEAEISDIIQDNVWYNSDKYPDFHKFLFDKLAHEYQEDRQIGKAFRSLHSLDDLKYNIPLDIVDNLLALCEKEEHSRLEEALITKPDGSTIYNDLLDLRGTYYLSKFQLEAALETFKKIPRAERPEPNLHPLRDAINDCVHCVQSDTSVFNKVTLVEKMLDLSYTARADMQRGAYAFYQLGLIFYNLSYYGNCWEGMDYFRSGSNWLYHNEENVYPLYGTPYGNHENKDCSQALFYFEKARLLTKDPELAARATFMAAKCEHNAWYNKKGISYSIYSNKIPPFPASYQTYFELLKKEYSDTEFYGQAIKECKYFRMYALK